MIIKDNTRKLSFTFKKITSREGFCNKCMTNNSWCLSSEKGRCVEDLGMFCVPPEWKGSRENPSQTLWCGGVWKEDQAFGEAEKGCESFLLVLLILFCHRGNFQYCFFWFIFFHFVTLVTGTGGEQTVGHSVELHEVTVWTEGTVMTLQLMRWVWEDNAAYFEYKRKTNTCFFRITIALCHFKAQILLVSYTKAEKPKPDLCFWIIFLS